MRGVCVCVCVPCGFEVVRELGVCARCVCVCVGGGSRTRCVWACVHVWGVPNQMCVCVCP